MNQIKASISGNHFLSNYRPKATQINFCRQMHFANVCVVCWICKDSFQHTVYVWLTHYNRRRLYFCRRMQLLSLVPCSNGSLCWFFAAQLVTLQYIIHCSATTTCAFKPESAHLCHFKNEKSPLKKRHLMPFTNKQSFDSSQSESSAMLIQSRALS